MSSDHAYIPLQDTYKALHTRLVSIGGRDVLMHYTVLSDTDGTALKTIDTKLRTSSMSYLYDIAEGNVPNHIPLNKFGHNNTVGNAYETIWSGSTLYPYLAAADQIEILSDSAQDDAVAVGTGAWTLKIIGLDANYDILEETITLDGAVVITTTAEFLRINRAIVLTAGTTHGNVGTITIRDQDTDTTRAIVEPMIGQTLMATWTVPADHTFFMTSWNVGSSLSKEIDIALLSRDNTIPNAAFQSKQFTNFKDTFFNHEKELPLKFTEKTDIEIRAKTAAGGGDISAGFDGWYEAN